MVKKTSRSLEQTSRLQGYGMVIVASTLFGINGSLSRFLLDAGISPVTLVEFRMLFGWLLLCAFLLIQNALRRIDATRVGIAAMFELVAGGIVAYLWLGQYLNIGQIVGCILVFVGIAILQYEG